MCYNRASLQYITSTHSVVRVRPPPIRMVEPSGVGKNCIETARYLPPIRVRDVCPNSLVFRMRRYPCSHAIDIHGLVVEDVALRATSNMNPINKLLLTPIL